MGTDMAEQNRRIVDIHEYLPVLIDIINTGKDVNLIVTGSSMAPFLCHQRDTIIISKPNDARSTALSLSLFLYFSSISVASVVTYESPF